MPDLDAPEPRRRASDRRGQYPAPRRQQEGPPCWLSMHMGQPRHHSPSRWALAGRSARSIRGAASGRCSLGIPFEHLPFPKRDRQNHSFQFWEHLFAAGALPHANVSKILRFSCVQNAVLRIVGKRYSQKWNERANSAPEERDGGVHEPYHQRSWRSSSSISASSRALRSSSFLRLFT